MKENKNLILADGRIDPLKEALYNTKKVWKKEKKMKEQKKVDIDTKNGMIMN